MLFYFIPLLITSSFGERGNPFKSPKIIRDENDPNHNTRFGEFIVHFSISCIAERTVHRHDIIKDFLDAIGHCYRENEVDTDKYPGTVDHWIRVDKICDEDTELETNDYCIISVEENEDYKLNGINQCVSRSVEEALWNLDSACPTVPGGVQYIEYPLGYDPGFDIIVMDSGIDSTHPEFDGVTIEQIYDGFPGSSYHSHGTHCSGTILGENYGVFSAKSLQIKVIDVRTFNTIGYSTTTVILNAYDAIIDYLQSIYPRKAIINHSWGGPNEEERTWRLATIRSLGGINIAAAGNGGYNAAWRSPASSNDSITVGAHDENYVRSDWPYGASNYGEVVDIWAPGTRIKSAVIGGGFDIWNGTSMATPFVTGVAANILANKQDLDFDGVKETLLNWAVNDVNDELGNLDLPRVQISCDEYCAAHGAACGLFYKFVL